MGGRDATSGAAVDSGDKAGQRQIPLPRPRPYYFDLRIDMTDMLGEDELANPVLAEQIAKARRPSGSDDLQDVR